MTLLNQTFIIIALFFASIECSESPSVLILGAGPSGIAAASRLLVNNVTTVKILEANGRIGGRIHSVEFGDAIIDLGGQWCHGQDNNIVYKMVKDLDLLEKDDMNTSLFYSSGQNIDLQLQNKLLELFEEFSEYENPEQLNTTIGEFFFKHYTEKVEEIYKNDEEELAIALDAYHLFDHYIMSLESAPSTYDISLSSNYIKCEGEQQLGWRGRGYKTILDVLMQKYPNPENELPVMKKIEFNKEVVEITWNANNFTGAIVKCTDGSEYRADHVIVTFSLGVLKNDYETLFNPPLPTEKVNAIKELGYGAVSKVFLHFPNNWWEDSNFTEFEFVWSKQDREELLNLTNSQESKVWLLDCMGLINYKANPNVLTAWFSGPSVKDIELYSDEKVISGIMFAADKFLGHLFDDITPPDNITRHKWYSDPYFRGTYSYQTIAANARSVSGQFVLAEPLISDEGKQTLLFAGEATHPHFFSTVHGAIETGQREADRIIHLYI